MPRRPRFDEPGTLHHATSRGLARRSTFDDAREFRFFCSRLARGHRRDHIRIHAFTALTNHFHLLVGSPTGEMSRGMRNLLSEYSRFFNRRHGRDGPLFRGRYHSRRIESDAYLYSVIRYIDRNAVDAGLAATAAEYPFGSARRYAAHKGPPWLSRSLVEGFVCQSAGHAEYRPDLYPAVLGEPLTNGEIEVVERRLRAVGPATDDLDRLLVAEAPELQEWLLERSVLADGAPLSLPLVSAGTVQKLVRERTEADPPALPRPRRSSASVWLLLLTGLLREACALTYREIGLRCGRSTSTAARDVAGHRALQLEDPDYRAEAAALLKAALNLDHAPALRRRRP